MDNKYNSILPLQMRFRDIDMFGHVNNTVYLEYMDLGKVNYINQVLGGLFNTTTDALVVANINCDFVTPTRSDENLAVHTRVDAIGEHSITLSQQVVNADNNQVKARARVIMVGYDAITATSRIIPDTWRERIARFEGRDF